MTTGWPTGPALEVLPLACGAAWPVLVAMDFRNAVVSAPTQSYCAAAVRQLLWFLLLKQRPEDAALIGVEEAKDEEPDFFCFDAHVQQVIEQLTLESNN